MDERVLKAAQAYLGYRDAAQRPRRASTTPMKPFTLRAAAEKYRVSPATLHRAVKRLSSGEPLGHAGRPPLFSSDEDEAIVAYVVWMQQGGFPATKSQVEAAAMTLRLRRDPDARPLSKNWYPRWIEAHPYLRKTTIKAVERNRKSFEATDTTEVETFFSRLDEITKKHRIGATEIWNEDECGVRIGSVRERISVVIVRSTRHRRPEIINPGNRESCTLIGAANAAGETMSPWIVFRVFPSESWSDIDGSGDIRFARSDTGFSNAEITLDWIHHFNIVSWTKSSRARRTGQSLEEWFGCTADLRGRVEPRFDSNKLKEAIEAVIRRKGASTTDLFNDGQDRGCKVFVCTAAKELYGITRLRSYELPQKPNLKTTICEAALATSAATGFFTPVKITGRTFVDGALGANNPVDQVEEEAADLWCPKTGELKPLVKCFISIGTGNPGKKPIEDNILKFLSKTLVQITTETEETARRFIGRWRQHYDSKRYFRFNVEQGLQDVGLAEYKEQGTIMAATDQYLDEQTRVSQVRDCVENVKQKQNRTEIAFGATVEAYHTRVVLRQHDFGPFKTPFSLDGVPASDKFVARPSDTAELEKCLLPKRSHARQMGRQIFVLFGLGGVGKTQLSIDFARRHQAAFSSVFWLDGRSEDQLKRSIAGYIAKIPKDQVPETSRRWTDSHTHSQDELDDAVANVMKWLEQPDNCEWLLVFDNVDKDWIGQEPGIGAYDPRRYLPGDHGSVLITTRLSRLAQLGESRKLCPVNTTLGKAILERWFGGELGPDCANLLELLQGLPLALAQAGSYLREKNVDAATYVRIYNEQWDELMGPHDASNRPLLDYNQESVRTTWTISFKEIERQSPSAAKLLRLWAFLDNKQLWHGLLAVTANGRTPQDRWPRWLSEMGGNEVRFLDAVGLLLRYSMIETEQGSKGSYSMHPVVHQWASYLDGQRQEDKWARLALAVVGRSVPVGETREYWVVQRKLIPHAEMVRRWIQKAVNRWYIGDDER
ncbi:hypothetical protein HIM_10840 [Hirsutella minnesotensis 3608]|uniref:PNPLA domain-containing protein n=1 Tax=Hirsutella minnesotensis 3608 TaxID=1043627 RepID=A0A0F7ZWY0_9HYPO|nr:hypothetical protein HIM_10840 [Hirsutella minnesotensis 3608]